jgi:hypothetical protein
VISCGTRINEINRQVRGKRNKWKKTEKEDQLLYKRGGVKENFLLVFERNVEEKCIFTQPDIAALPVRRVSFEVRRRSFINIAHKNKKTIIAPPNT